MGNGGGHWKESPKKNALNELQDKLMSVRLREAQAQAELREVKLKAVQLESQVRAPCSQSLSGYLVYEQISHVGSELFGFRSTAYIQ